MRRMPTVEEIIDLIKKHAEGGDIHLIADEYDDTATYAKGDVVAHDDKLYQAKQDILTAEAWDATHWDETNVYDALRGYLKGKFVSIYTPAELNAMTPEQKIAVFSEGLFVNGDYAGIHNPLFSPAKIGYANNYYGTCLGVTEDNPFRNGFHTYNLVPETGSIAVKSMFYQTGANLWVFDGNETNGFNFLGTFRIGNKNFPAYPSDSDIGKFICRKGTLEYYVPVAVTGITSGDNLAGVQDDLVNAMKDHLDVEINGYRARYQYEDNGYVVYSSMAEADSGVNLQVNMISLLIASPNTISFNQMKFVPTT